MKNLFLIVCVVGGVVPGLSQSFSDKTSKELAFEKKTESNTLILANINGSIRVSGYEGDKVILEVSRTISAKTAERLEKGKKEVQLGMIDRADTLIVYAADGCNSFGKHDGNSRNGGEPGGWSYQWDCRGNNCHTDFDYTMNFVLKVPFRVNVMVSTINEGDILVENMKGAVDANNINGSIRLSNVVREVQVSTINGDVDVDYAYNPGKASRFYTLNGDINANFQKGLAASLSFESFNGNLYTNVPQLEALPVTVQKQATEDGIRYKVNGNRFKVGQGGVQLDFETFNGDVYVKEK